MDRSKFHILEDGCQAFGVTLTEKQIEQFEKYYELLVEWNKVMNLTGITEFDEVMQKHFVDSVAAAEVVDNLGLIGIETVHGRAEDAAKKAEYREQFDLSVSRAVANLASLTEYCLPFVKVGGKFVSYKSVSVDEEIAQSKKAVYVLGGEIGKVEKFHLPGSDMERALVVVEKKRSTPKKYPRKAGMPTKEPLA